MDVAIFDMDGTLIDSMPGLTELAVEVMHRNFYLRKDLCRSEYLRTVGLPFSEQLAKIFPGSRPARVVATSVYERAKRDVTLAAPVFPEISKKLQWHRNKNHATVLVSSTTRSLVDEVLVAKSLMGYFTHVYGYVGQDKESQVNEFMAHNGEQVTTCVYYGDSDEDKRIAKIFGIDFVRVGRDGTLC